MYCELKNSMQKNRLSEENRLSVARGIEYFLGLSLGILFMTVCFSSALTLPQDFNYSSRIDALVDAGFIWNLNSLIHPLSCLTDSSK